MHRTWVPALVLAAATSCSGGDEPGARGTPTPTSAFTLPPRATLDPRAALTRAFATTTFRPGFSLRLPAGWSPVERRVDAFQAYLGDEELEITLDHSYRRRESVARGVARLRATPTLLSDPQQAVVVGGRRGVAFVGRSDTPLFFADSGFHPGGGPVTIMVLPVPDGTTLTVFLTVYSDTDADMAQLRQLTDRVFATLRWQ